jgi:hypothetical protein
MWGPKARGILVIDATLCKMDGEPSGLCISAANRRVVISVKLRIFWFTKIWLPLFLCQLYMGEAKAFEEVSFFPRFASFAEALF